LPTRTAGGDLETIALNEKRAEGGREIKFFHLSRR
jgi:hypothetical protein